MFRWFLMMIAMSIVAPFALADSGILNVHDFGAVADAKTDDTAAFQKALDEAAKTGTRAFVPAGRYVLRGHLTIPEHVTLEGVFQAPERTVHTEGTLEKERGTILLAYEGKGSETGEAFVTLNGNAHVRGVIIFYPEQNNPKNIVAFPWTVRADGDNCTITNPAITIRARIYKPL